jgi:hypothetical protein
VVVNVVAREIAAIPVRTSVQTWQAIAGLLAPAGSGSRLRLDAVTNIAAILITSEYTAQAPIVVMPASGPRVRIRTVHGLNAIDALPGEIPLAASPCAEPGWTMSLPCGIDDLEEMRTALLGHPGIEVRELTDGVTTEDAVTAKAAPWSFNYDELEKP